jgi:RecA/RadA recombinase
VAKKNKEEDVSAADDMQAYALDFDEMVDSVHKELDVMPVALNRADFVVNAVPSGILTLDLIIGGGWHFGKWIVLFGLEGSGKSSTLYFSLTQAVALGIPVVFLDYEVSTDPDYLSRILNQPLDTLFGKKDDQGKWVTKPMVRYEQPETAEKGFRLMHRILKKLPNKIQVGNEYYFVYDPDIHKDIDKRLKAAGQTYVKDENGKFRVRAKDGLPQIIFFVDSFIAMFPEARDNDDEKSAMAQVARVFSENASMVKSRLGAKRACIIGTNQMRLRPGGYGDPSYEPGGETIKFFSDCRVRTRTIAVPAGTGQVEEEDCWDGDGIDRYRYVSVSVPKNKVFSPFRQSTLRFWFEEKGGPGRGVDPVFDCFQYLEETGQVSGKGRYMIAVPGPWVNRAWTWKEFKRLILNPDRYELYKEFGFADADVDALLKEFKKAGGANPYIQYEDKAIRKLAKELRARLDALVDLRGTCRKQIQDSSAFHMYFAVAGKTKKATVVADISKTCRNCKNWKVTKNCKKTKADDGCKDWDAKEIVKAKKGNLKALAKKAKEAIDDVVDAEDNVKKKKKSMTLDC